MNIKLPDDFVLVKNIVTHASGFGFEYIIEIVDIVRANEKTYLREYNNSCGSGGNGRPNTYECDKFYCIPDDADITKENYISYIFDVCHLKPEFVLCENSGVYNDNEAIEFCISHKREQ